MISSDAQRRREKILQEYVADYQRTMDNIESDNIKIEKHTETGEKRSLVSIEMAMV